MTRLLVDATALHAADLHPPVSKSDAHRALILASITGAPPPDLGPQDALPDDVRVLARGLETLQAGSADTVVDCADGGAPFRFLLALAATHAGRTTTFTGSARLAQRPHGALRDALERALGARLEDSAGWPLRVTGGPPRARLFNVDAEASSQFASAMLLAACRLVVVNGPPYAVRVTHGSTSRGYLEMTLQWARRAGFVVVVEGDVLSVTGWAPSAVPPAVPPDWSAMGYLLLVSWACGGQVIAPGAASCEHPDRAILRHVAALGLDVEVTGDVQRVSGHARGGLHASAAGAPDLVPTLVALACTLEAASTFTDLDVLRHKESDRLSGVVALARAAGARTDLEGDRLVVVPGATPAGAPVVHCGNDHRMIMAATALACLRRCTVQLDNAFGLAKSFPRFFSELGGAGVRVQAA
ncbi:MAG: 3-phosphoshikimate 1-carboxyvinyltransferase [Deltaproteobacteria bacterium]|nr:3-phosphoshikimate 1-carboxyvinyltransferase [Deltaproteobacteria bacterium]